MITQDKFKSIVKSRVKTARKNSRNLNSMKKVKVLLALVVIVATSFVSSRALAATSVKENYRQAYLNMNWWKKFNDPILEDYLLKAYSNNHDLKIASAKIKQGQQVVRQSLGQEMPQMQLFTSFDRTMRSSDIYHGQVLIPDYSQSQFLIPLTMNYEIDIWGKNRLRTKSAQKQLDILKQSERATYISLTSSLASEYYTLVKMDKMIEYQNGILALQKNILALTEAKYKNGLASFGEVLFERKNLTLAQEEKNLLEQEKEVLTNQLRVLLDLPQDAKLERVTFENISCVEIPSQINSDVIENRPDFIISSEQLKKMGIDVKVAQKELLPSFILSGQIGFNAYEWGKIFNGNSFLSSLGILPCWNVFTGGRKIAYLKFKKYEYEEAAERYRKAVLTSLQEVNDSLVIAKTAQKNYQGSIERLKLENENYELVSKKYSIGGISDLQKMKSQEALLISEKMEVSNKINLLISAIGLYKAVGGHDISKLEDDKV